jgi:hypothetical protein
MTSMFGSTYLCKSAFSNMTFMKSRYGSSLADGSLQHLVRLATTGIEVDIPALVSDVDHPPSISLKGK